MFCYLFIIYTTCNICRSAKREVSALLRHEPTRVTSLVPRRRQTLSRTACMLIPGDAAENGVSERRDFRVEMRST